MVATMGLPNCQIGDFLGGFLFGGGGGGGKQNPEAKSRHDNIFLRTGYCQVIHDNNGYSHDASVSQDINCPNDSPESCLSYSLTSPRYRENMRTYLVIAMIRLNCPRLR